MTKNYETLLAQLIDVVDQIGKCPEIETVHITQERPMKAVYDTSWGPAVGFETCAPQTVSILIEHKFHRCRIE